MPEIHQTAIVSPEARLAADVRIGPFCTVGPRVTLMAGVNLVSHVVVDGRTEIGAGTTIYPFASLGHAPQSIAYKGEDTGLIIGEKNLIREGVTMNPGTASARGETRIGSNCMFMAGSHVAHDCWLGNNIIMANNVMLGGHVTIGDYVWLGGGSAVHQWSRVGMHAFVGGMAGLEGDLIPFGSVMGNRAHLAGLNLVGLKRRGFSREVIHDLRNAYRLLFAEEGTFQERLEDVAELFVSRPEVMSIVEFVREGGERPLCMPNRET
ncbi:MAG: acyl-ACP--UDP-N-acetylglucosamine O-acyltransferase [Alphaproteobacteria bacterium]|nr:acyl-ACP--UDP-N-acetylglucosamine O-acyltransferase [Alphaproteobacteria bacterium]